MSRHVLRHRGLRQLHDVYINRLPLDREAGQATVEYALVVLAAAAIALLLVAWAARSGKIGELADRVFDSVVAKVS
ncbi:MAG: DUF4244 domain-containing protein [Acidimicrobiales bacterium]|nr:DUF4244 domain-containing protein [Acidimicrobiales bacterium]